MDCLTCKLNFNSIAPSPFVYLFCTSGKETDVNFTGKPGPLIPSLSWFTTRQPIIHNDSLGLALGLNPFMGREKVHIMHSSSEYMKQVSLHWKQGLLACKRYCLYCGFEEGVGPSTGSDDGWGRIFIAWATSCYTEYKMDSKLLQLVQNHKNNNLNTFEHFNKPAYSPTITVTSFLDLHTDVWTLLIFQILSSLSKMAHMSLSVQFWSLCLTHWRLIDG